MSPVRDVIDEGRIRDLMVQDEGECLEFKESLPSRKVLGEYAVGIGNEGGGWFGSVNEHNILVTESQRRNELLASAFQRIGLAERSALGVKRMFLAMLEAGKEPPEYRATSATVTVTLRDGAFDQQFAALVRRCVEEGVELSVFDLLLLLHLRRHRELTVDQAAEVSQQGPRVARRMLDDLRNHHLVDRVEGGRPRKYVLGSLAYDRLNLLGQRPRDLGMSATTVEGLVLEELERRREAGLTNREIREWSKHGRVKTTEVLRALVARGAVVWSGKRGRGARYWLPAYAPGPGLRREDGDATDE